MWRASVKYVNDRNVLLRAREGKSKWKPSPATEGKEPQLFLHRACAERQDYIVKTLWSAPDWDTSSHILLEYIGKSDFSETDNPLNKDCPVAIVQLQQQQEASSVWCMPIIQTNTAMAKLVGPLAQVQGKNFLEWVHPHAHKYTETLPEMSTGNVELSEHNVLLQNLKRQEQLLCRVQLVALRDEQLSSTPPVFLLTVVSRNLYIYSC